jgi:hypothetical protein
MTILAFISVIIIHSIPKGKNVKCLIQPFHLQQEMTGGIELKLSFYSQYLSELLKKPTVHELLTWIIQWRIQLIHSLINLGMKGLWFPLGA